MHILAKYFKSTCTFIHDNPISCNHHQHYHIDLIYCSYPRGKGQSWKTTATLWNHKHAGLNNEFQQGKPSYRPCTFCKSVSLRHLHLYQEFLTVHVRCANPSTKTVELNQFIQNYTIFQGFQKYYQKTGLVRFTIILTYNLLVPVYCIVNSFNFILVSCKLHFISLISYFIYSFSYNYLFIFNFLFFYVEYLQSS